MRSTTENHPHAMGIPEQVRSSLANRLARIRGQVDGIQRMVADERYCPDILQQFAAIHASLRSAEKALFQNHLERCATHAIEMGGESATEARRELVDLFYRYLR